MPDIWDYRNRACIACKHHRFLVTGGYQPGSGAVCLKAINKAKEEGRVDRISGEPPTSEVRCVRQRDLQSHSEVVMRKHCTAKGLWFEPRRPCWFGLHDWGFPLEDEDSNTRICLKCGKSEQL